jgi:hypothetical protein
VRRMCHGVWTVSYSYIALVVLCFVFCGGVHIRVGLYDMI